LRAPLARFEIALAVRTGPQRSDLATSDPAPGELPRVAHRALAFRAGAPGMLTPRRRRCCASRGTPPRWASRAECSSSVSRARSARARRGRNLGPNDQVPPRPDPFLRRARLAPPGGPCAVLTTPTPTKSAIARRMSRSVMLEKPVLKLRLWPGACALCAAATPGAQNQIGGATALLDREHGVQLLAPTRTRARGAWLARAAGGGSGKSGG